MSVSELPFIGRSCVILVEDQNLISVVLDMRNFLQETNEMRKKDILWSNLNDELKLLVDSMASASESESNQTCWRQYRLDLVNKVIFPYVKSMKNRISLDKDRFQQLHDLIEFISERKRSNDDDDIFYVLDEVDRMIVRIESKQMFFKSELASKLREYHMFQWRPIIRDHKRSLRRIAGYLLALGFVELIGRPAAILYPLLIILQSVLKISQTLDEVHMLRPEAILGVAKAVLMIFVVSKAIWILDAYTGK